MSYRMIAAAATGAVLLAGCGTTTASDVAQIRKVIGDYGRALADGDGERACAMMTADGQAGVIRANREFGVTRCREVAVKIRALAEADELSELRRLRIESVEVRGDRAVGQLAGLRALEATGKARLRRIGGRWLIDRDVDSTAT